MKLHEIRADYDRTSVVVYQAYGPHIGEPAVEHGRFVPPFSRSRMTWIKPSFLWMMERCGWAGKPGQEMVLAVRISREGWEDALSQAVLTNPDRRLYRSSDEWRDEFRHAKTRVQWDPERTLRGQKMEARSIQVGLSRHVIDQYADEWVLEIKDLTPTVHKIHKLVRDGDSTKAAALLPRERAYPVSPELAGRIGADV